MKLSEISQSLSQKGFRLSGPRKEIIDYLGSGIAPVTAANLSLKFKKYPRSTIYRNLEALELAGIVKRSLIKWKRHYELNEPYLLHHHHLACSNCQRIVEFDSPAIESLLHDVATQHDFKLTNHVLELSGRCEQCSWK